MKQQTIYDGSQFPRRSKDISSLGKRHNNGEGDARFSASEFSILRRLAASPDSGLAELRDSVGEAVAGGSFLEDLDRLHRRYVVDCVTFLEGKRVKTVYSLTPDGREAFLEQLASLYEIPE